MKKLTPTLSFILFIMGCSMSVFCPQVGTIDLSQFAVNGVSLNQKYNDVISVLGKPLEDSIDGFGGNWRNVNYPGMELSFDDDELVLITVTSEKWRLSSGIGIGSMEADIAKAYGCAKKKVADEKVIYAYDHNKKEGKTQFDLLQFMLVDGIVAKIEFSTIHSRI